METQCNQQSLTFPDEPRMHVEPCARREVVAQFDGGAISSDGGGLLLRVVEKRTAILKRLASCLTDHRDPQAIKHRVEQLISQYILLNALRQMGLHGSEQARIQCDTLRVKLLKIGAQLRITVRKVWIALSQSCPYAAWFREVLQRLRAYPLPG